MLSAFGEPPHRWLIADARLCIQMAMMLRKTSGTHVVQTLNVHLNTEGTSVIAFQVRVPKEEADLVSDLRYTWRKVRHGSLARALEPLHDVQ